MKEPRSVLGKTDLTSREMREVVIHTEEPVSTREDISLSKLPPLTPSILIIGQWSYVPGELT